MSEIERRGESARWSDVVIHNGIAYWVEVAEGLHLDVGGQVRQVLSQIDATLAQLGSDRFRWHSPSIASLAGNRRRWPLRTDPPCWRSRRACWWSSRWQVN